MRPRGGQYIAWASILVLILVVAAQFPFFRPIRDTARKVIGVPVSVADVSGGKVRSFFRLLGSIGDLSQENNTLREENNNLKAQLADLLNLKNENEQLKKDLKFANTRHDLELMPVSIINYSPAGSFQAVTINKGEKDGLKLEQVVVSAGYLIGKIKRISDHTAEVWLLSNRNLITPVLIVESNTSGILKGGIRGLVVDTIPIDAQIKPNQTVVTASLENLYPAGIAVGKVEEVISSKEEIFVEVRVNSPINIRNVQTIFVVIG